MEPMDRCAMSEHVEITRSSPRSSLNCRLTHAAYISGMQLTVLTRDRCQLEESQKM